MVGKLLQITHAHSFAAHWRSMTDSMAERGELEPMANVVVPPRERITAAATQTPHRNTFKERYPISYD